jgi:hypothetical protein
MRRTIAVLVLAGFLPLSTTGCFGGFQLVRKVYQFNREVSPDKWIRELAFLFLTIIPVYGAAAFLDAVIFNSVEFWTGHNPVLAAIGASKTIRTEEGTATLTRIDGQSLDVRLRRTDGREDRFILTRDAAGFSGYSPDGRLLARVADEDAEFRVAALAR